MATQTSKYMLASERDELWGLIITTVGYEEINPGDSYPTHGHADGYYFDVEKGRVLNEYQLLYIVEGEGVLHTRTVREARLHEGDIFLLFPGEWHSYHPPHADGRNTGSDSAATTWTTASAPASSRPKSPSITSASAMCS